jgi:hypothetical protein
MEKKNHWNKISCFQKFPHHFTKGSAGIYRYSPGRGCEPDPTGRPLAAPRQDIYQPGHKANTVVDRVLILAASFLTAPSKN